MTKTKIPKNAMNPLVNGVHVQDAITCELLSGVTGKITEKQYFRVMDCRGDMGLKDPVKYFYQTPSDYEKKGQVSINKEVKENWIKSRYIHITE